MRKDPIPDLKGALGDEIVRALAGWRAADAAVLLGLHPARVSNLRNRRLERFSLETLVRVLHRFGRAVTVSVRARDNVGRHARDETQGVKDAGP
jgi:predicted XRE-type DNA-binding protein